MEDVTKKFQKRIFDSQEFVQKDSIVKSYFDVAAKELNTIEDRGIQAGIMANYKKRVMDSDEGRAFMTTNNYGPYLPELWPIITAWYPEFPLKELISVQDMEQDLAYIITSKLLTATDKANTGRGEEVETPTGPRKIHGSYPTGEVMGEELKDTDFAASGSDSVGALAYFPLMTDVNSMELYKAAYTVGGTTSTYDQVTASGQNLQFSFSGSTPSGCPATVTVEVSTGVVTLTGFTPASGDVLTMSYVWNIEYANDNNIPSVVEDMQMVPMIARPRVIAMKWTIFSEYLKKKQFGLDIRTQNTQRALNLMYQYQVRYILDRLYNGSTASQEGVTIPTNLVDLNLVVQNVLNQLNTISNGIMTTTGRIEGNQLIVGNFFKSWLEALPDTFYKPFEQGKDVGFNGPRKIGSFGRFTVYYDDKIATNSGAGITNAWMTYRGKEWYDAAFYLGVFLPLAPTDAINININVRQAFVEMCAYKYDKPAAVVPVVIQ